VGRADRETLRRKEVSEGTGGTGEYRALVVRETAERGFVTAVERLPMDALPQGDVLIRVRYSSLNYKDALSATGNRGVTKRYPHTPGIDAAGVVEHSAVESFTPGDEVLVTGYELGSNHPGGFAGFIRVPAAWVIPLPAGLSPRESMILGTAGFTAALSVHRLLHNGITPDAGDVLVTGASGGVGSIAVNLLARLGYATLASTGKSDAADLLLRLGARRVLSREEVLDATGMGLLGGRWAGVVDTVGGLTLDSAIRATQPFGAVAACGNVTSPHLRTSVYPFILRGVALLGINSAFTPFDLRSRIWSLLAGPWKPDRLEELVTEGGLDDLPEAFRRILAGRVTGRYVIRL
jgi:putative YhdH/YhfP family quinone oxidoreductase